MSCVPDEELWVFACSATHVDGESARNSLWADWVHAETYDDALVKATVLMLMQYPVIHGWKHHLVRVGSVAVIMALEPADPATFVPFLDVSQLPRPTKETR